MSLKKQKQKNTGKAVEVISGNANPLFTKMSDVKALFPDWEFCASKDQSLDKEAMWQYLEKRAQPLLERYAWAIPDDRSLRVLKHFSPLIEIGSGKGYWAKLLRNKGVDIVASDKFMGKSKECWTEVICGGPELLADSKICTSNRNLFLCYPDEAESMAIQCLEQFAGEYIIHVGELVTQGGCGTMAGAPVAPFGRTSSSQFQITLAEQFHCMLVAQLECCYPYSKDCISVWKRTEFIAGRERPDLDSPTSHKKKKSKKVDVALTAAVASKDEGEFISMADLEALRNGGSISGTSSCSSSSSSSTSSSSSGSAPAAPAVTDPEEAARAWRTDGLRALHLSNIEQQNKLAKRLQRLREAQLDIQYDEDCDNRWAAIPKDEQLPVDRAAPSLVHLL